MIDGHGVRMDSKPVVVVDLRQLLVLLQHTLSLAGAAVGSLIENEVTAAANRVANNTPPHHHRGPPPEPTSNGIGLGGGPLLNSPIDPDKEYDLHFVAKQLRKSTASVRKMVNAGKIEADKKGNGKGQFFVKGRELLKHTSTMVTYS
jgi:hypothetical protein